MKNVKRAVGALLVLTLVAATFLVVMADEPPEPTITTERADPYQEMLITNTITSFIEGVWFDPGMGLELGTDTTRQLRPAERNQTEVGLSGFLGNIGWTQAGEWVQYTVTVVEADTYRVYAYLAAAGPAGNVRVYIDNVLLGQTASTDTRGWQVYDWHFIGEADLTPGEIVITVYFINGNTNFAALRFWTETGVMAEVAAIVSSYADAAAAAAAEIQAAADAARNYANEAAAANTYATSAEELADDAWGYADAARDLADIAAASDDYDAVRELAEEARDLRDNARALIADANMAQLRARTAARPVVGALPPLGTPAAAPADDAAPAGTAAADNGGGGNVGLIVGIAGGAVVLVIIIVVIVKKRAG